MKRIANPKAIHICNSHEPLLRPKIAKEYVLPTHRENKTCSKFERKIYRNEYQCLTKYIVNGGKLLNTSILHKIKDSAKPKDLCSEIRH